MNAPAAPSFAELHAAPGWRRIDFISDLHLSGATPRTLAAFDRYLGESPADAVIILGDLFDAWIGDDSRHDGIEQRVAGILTQASHRLSVYFMVGNRDFLLGAEMLRDCGVAALDDPTVLVAFGQRALLTHGDSLCLADHGYQRFRTRVRQPGWQREFLGRPLEARREEARRLRSESHAAQSHNGGDPPASADLDAPAMVQWLDESRSTWLIHGHTHRPGSEDLGSGHSRHVLSDWDFDGSAQPARGEVLSWEASGLSRRRLDPASAQT